MSRRPQAKHVGHATWKGQANDNRKMERLNGEIRDREKVMRSLKRERYAYLDGLSDLPQPYSTAPSPRRQDPRRAMWNTCQRRKQVDDIDTER